MDTNNVIMNELMEVIKQLTCKIDNLEKINQEVLDKLNINSNINSTKISKKSSTRNTIDDKRLQQINPETLELIKVFETVSEAMKEHGNIKRPSLNKAVLENTIYRGYRWLLVDRELDANVIHNILPTKPIKEQNMGYIAQINREKTEIVNVYLDRKTACRLNGYSSTSALDISVKNFSLSKDFYYKLYEDCNSDLKKGFIKKNNGYPPILYTPFYISNAYFILLQMISNNYVCILILFFYCLPILDNLIHLYAKNNSLLHLYAKNNYLF